jgi:hypothetical protein
MAPEHGSDTAFCAHICGKELISTLHGPSVDSTGMAETRLRTPDLLGDFHPGTRRRTRPTFSLQSSTSADADPAVMCPICQDGSAKLVFLAGLQWVFSCFDVQVVSAAGLRCSSPTWHFHSSAAAVAVSLP